MGVIDDLKYTAKALSAKISRIGEIATKIEKDPRTKKDIALFKAMSVDIDNMHRQYTETLQKIAAYNAKQNPRIDEDLEPDLVEFEVIYYNIKAIAEITMTTEEKLNQSITANNSNTTGHNSSPIGVSLPKLKIVEFNGDIRAWSNFSELYTETIHTHPQLSEIQKYMYLRSLLKGEALAQIASLPITAANYPVAWSALQVRYNDSNLLTNSYLESLFALSPVSREAAQLRTFATLLTEYTGALVNLGHDVEGWAVPLLFLFVKRLSPPLRERWEKIAMKNEPPKITDFITFISDEARILEAVQAGSSSRNPKSPRNVTPSSPMKRSLGTHTFMVHTDECALCNEGHFIAKCSQFQKKSPTDRHRFAKSSSLCLNCLQVGHMMKQCPSRNVCKQCKARHHTLLHFKSTPPETKSAAEGMPTALDEGQQGAPEPSVEIYHANTALSDSVILLATAQAYLEDRHGQMHKVKILIDSASQGTFITRSCADRLKLPTRATAVPLFGMAQTTLGVAKGVVTCKFQRMKNIELSVDALIVDRIANCPSMTVQPAQLQHLHGLELADVDYFRTQSVDVLIGAEWFGSVVLGNTIVGPPGTPTALETIWGYCLVGRIKGSSAPVATFCTMLDNRLDLVIRKFWEVEQPPACNTVSEEDRVCEELYQSTVKRTITGRYVVELPIRSTAPVLGDSRALALRRFLSLKRNLAQTPALRQRYNEFMQDYLNQGHMTRVTDLMTSSKDKSYYIPHHCIYRADSTVTKFRVVFDASMKTIAGASLNETLYVGPKLQADLVELLIAFRLHAIVLVTDIRQMYRNIKISNKHQNLQRIFWRFAPEEPLEEFRLTTVTYGVSASPFLAIRTLKQLVIDEGTAYPAAAQAITRSTYMDDVATSVPSIKDALTLQQELIELMARGGFELRKWMSNSPDVLQNLDPEHCAMRADTLSFEDDNHVAKILGLVWNPHADTFSYRIALTQTTVTKRTILSDVARLFDPLGYICPVTFYGKWLIQYLWQLGLSWDEPVPEEVGKRWHTFRQQLPQLAAVALPRNICIDTATCIHVHGFADSSEKGYAGVVYVHSEQANGNAQLSLIIAKSKVAPLKKATLPRLELCAIVLTAKLVQYVIKTIEHYCDITSTTVWTDSRVALAWVQSSPHKWHTYVANRVSEAQSYVAPQHYRHVPSEKNPADCASRGLLPSELIEHPLWLSGPPWIVQHRHTWPAADESDLEEIQRVLLPEARVISLPTTIEVQDNLLDRLMARASSLKLLKYRAAWCLRYVHNLRCKSQGKAKITGALSAMELSEALKWCVKLVQHQEFTEDINRIKRGEPATSRLRRLHPYLEDGILRVGGRLRHSNLTTERKHPIVIPKSHQLTLLIIDYYHQLHLHPGTQTLHAIIQTQFWILSARSVIRHRTGRCITCFRTRPRHTQPMMGDLPAARLNEIKPFAITGVDYGGPFEVTLGRIRKAKIYKAYICLFVCFATKAVHLELVSELTTDAFLAALRRFIARRGHVKAIHSDCGTNFVGARRKLTEWHEFVASRAHNEIIQRQLADRNIEWHLNPPAGPHFGGLWEAGIKSTKHLLQKVIGSQILTYEEFYTVLVQVEATLNSRPLTPSSSDPTDLQALTPGHFLFLEAPAALIEPEVHKENVSNNQRWKLLQLLNASFWKRWSSEYLCTLQQRTKWTRSGPNIEEGSLVLIKEDNAPPLEWRMGRVKRVFPGPDRIVRVAEVKTATGVLTRPVVKLCPLPIN